MGPKLILTKPLATGALRNILHNYVLGLVFIGFSDELKWPEIGASVFTAESPPLRVDIPLAPLLGGISSLTKERPIAVREFLGMLRRASIAESHELLLAYCEHTTQFPKYKALTWFQFARIVRNAVSHKQGGIVEWPKDLKKAGVLEVKWRHRTIRPSDDATELQMPDAEGLQLIGDMMEFLEAGLT